MEIWNIIQMIFGGGVVAGIVEACAAIRHRKADKVKAEAEAAQASATLGGLCDYTAIAWLS